MELGSIVLLTLWSRGSCMNNRTYYTGKVNGMIVNFGFNCYDFSGSLLRVCCKEWLLFALCWWITGDKKHRYYRYLTPIYSLYLYCENFFNSFIILSSCWSYHGDRASEMCGAVALKHRKCIGLFVYLVTNNIKIIKRPSVLLLA